MLRLAKLSIRRPKAAIAIWLVAVVGLGIAGLSLENNVSPTILVVPGTESERAQEISVENFGETTLVPVVVQGPQADINRQGPGIVGSLRELPYVRVLSPWDRAEGTEQLRPARDKAAIIVSVNRSEQDVLDTHLARIERRVSELTFPPVRTTVTGQATIDRELKSVALADTRRAEVIALAVVLVLLLVITRAPVAALVTAAFGVTVIPVAYGITSLMALFVKTDAVAAAFTSMLGLALGVGFAMLMVSRFRDGLREGFAPPHAALRATTATGGAGRTVLLAATALAAGMIVADLLSPTVILTSVGIGATTVTIVAGTAVVGVLPGLLTLLGPRIGAFAFAQGEHGAATGAAGRMIRHPATVAAATLAALLLLAAPALDAETGPPDVTQLPADNQARKDFETFTSTLGEGWAAPYEVYVVSRSGPITTERTLRRVDGLQRTLAADLDITSVVGPGDVHASAQELRKLPVALKQAPKTTRKSAKNLDKLISGLQQATAGVHKIKEGIAGAADGAGQLDTGSGSAAGGASKLRAGLEAAEAGSAELFQGLTQADAGAKELSGGSAEALAGAKILAGGIGEADKGVGEGLPTIQRIVAGLRGNETQLGQLSGLAQEAQQHLASALQQLDAMTVAPGDPGYAQYQAALAELTRAAALGGDVSGGLQSLRRPFGDNMNALRVVEQQIGELSAGLKRLHGGADELVAGLGQLAEGNRALSEGIGKLSSGSGELNQGLGQLAAGARALEAGLDKIAGGTAQLAEGLGDAREPSAKLGAGMDEITSAVIRSRRTLPSTKDIEQLFGDSPHLFDSGYFVLAAVQGAPAADREQASFAVNVTGGGLAGRITVVPRFGAADPGMEALGDRIELQVERFGEKTGLVTAIGGPGAQLSQYESEVEHVPLVVAGLSLTALVLLVIVLRSVVLPLVAVALNLLTAAAVFALLVPLFGPGDPLGGPDYIDPISMVGILAVVLGLSVDYQLFVLGPARASWLRTNDPDEAIAAMRRTSPVVIGIAATMVGVFAAFAGTDIAAVRQFAVGAAIAVLIDVALVRPLLLPAAMRLLGTRAWWAPRFLAPTPASAPEPARATPVPVAPHTARRRAHARRTRKEKERT